MVLEVFGAACALIGGLGLFIAGEQDRRTARGIVAVEPCENRRCARCDRPAKICRFDSTMQRWVYGVEAACLEQHCLPRAILGGDYILEPIAPLQMLERSAAQREFDCVRCKALFCEKRPPHDRWWLLHGHHNDFCGPCRDWLIEFGTPRLVPRKAA